MSLNPWGHSYNGTPVSRKYLDRWRSRKYVGDAKPYARVRVRRAYLKHGDDGNATFHNSWPGPNAPATVSDSANDRRFGQLLGLPLFPMWYPEWTPLTDWVDLPGVHEIDIQQSVNFAGGDGGDGSGGAGGTNGVAVATLTLDNAAWAAVAGGLGTYHEKQRGVLWPWRGYTPANRPGSTVSKNQWYGQIPNAQIEITQGYGSDAAVKIFTGLIDQVGPSELRPDRATLTSRDLGGILVDSYMFHWNKDPRLRDPTYFIPPNYPNLPKLGNNKTHNWIVVKDATDIVRCGLRWCGFKEWDIEDAGVNLKTPYLIDRSKTWMDTVNDLASALGYVFFIAEPTSDDLSMGVPVFRKQSVLYSRNRQQPTLLDSTILTDIEPQHDNSNDRYIIRTRGRYATRVQGGRPILGGDETQDGKVLFTATYYPPWAKRMGQIIKQLTYYNIGQNGVMGFSSDPECEVAAVLIAVQIALGRETAVIEAPANAGMGLDCMAFLNDADASGVVSRLYVTGRHTVMTLGGDGSSQTPPSNAPGSVNNQLLWSMQLTGALCDSPEWDKLIKDYETVLAGQGHMVMGWPRGFAE